jgi:hypothetical protein
MGYGDQSKLKIMVVPYSLLYKKIFVIIDFAWFSIYIFYHYEPDWNAMILQELCRNFRGINLIL